jgi:hypothetical protein
MSDGDGCKFDSNTEKGKERERREEGGAHRENNAFNLRNKKSICSHRHPKPVFQVSIILGETRQGEF